MSGYYVTAAATPPLPIRSGRRDSQQPSRSFTSRTRSPNDALVSAPSPELIHDLLSSFSAIAVPSDDTLVHPALRVDPRRDLIPAVTERRTFSLTGNRHLRVPENSYPRHSSLRSADNWSLKALNDAAEPPVVRRSRFAQSSSRSSGYTSPVSAIPPDYDLDGGLASYGTIRDASYGATPFLHPDGRAQRQHRLGGLSEEPLDYGNSYTPTLRKHSDEFSLHGYQANTPTLATPTNKKGKEKAIDTPVTRPPRLDTYDSPRPARLYLAPSVSSSSHHSTARSSFNSDANQLSAAPANYHNRFGVYDSTGHASSGSGRPSEDWSSAHTVKGSVVVPPRGSSLNLRRADSLSLFRKYSAAPSIASHNPEAARPSEPVEQVLQQALGQSPEEDSEVLRRIKELKAAKEARSKSLTNQTTPYAPQEVTTYSLTGTPNAKVASPIVSPAVPPFPSVPPVSASARMQLASASHQHQRSISNDVSKFETGFVPSSVYSSTPRMSADILHVEYVNFSRDKPRVVRTPSPSKLDSSRTTPTRKRWSQQQLGFRTSATASPQPGFMPTSTPQSELSSPRRPSSRPFGHEPNVASHDWIGEAVSDYLQSVKFSQKITVPGENRTIAFSEVGDPTGHAVFCCVGMGMTRYIMAFYDELASSLKLRLITPDRPGIGESEAYPGALKQPIYWPDDIDAICRHLGIRDFSLLAHSAGAIYALATALRMPSNINGRLHLLAPWIPPSQMTAPAVSGNTPDSAASSPGGTLPKSQRFLRMLPTPFLRLSTSSWMVNAGLNRTKSPRPSTRSRSNLDLYRNSTETSSATASPRISFGQLRAAISRKSSNIGDVTTATIDDVVLASIPDDEVIPGFDSSNLHSPTGIYTPEMPTSPSLMSLRDHSDEAAFEHQKRYDAALTPAIWELATKNANPTVDLLVCLERQQNIGFRYVDVDLGRYEVVKEPEHGDLFDRVPTVRMNVSNGRSGASTPRSRELRSNTPSMNKLNKIGSNEEGGVRSKMSRLRNGDRTPSGPGTAVASRIVIHHGSKDQRVPLENVKWLGRMMKGVELRVVDGEGHGLMASAGVMAQVLTEMSRELEAM